EELAGLSIWELQRLCSTPGKLQQAAPGFSSGAGDGSAREQIAGTQIAAIARVMGEHLRHRPVEISQVAPTQPDRLQSSFPHACRPEVDLNDCIDTTSSTITFGVEVRQRAGIPLWPAKSRGSIRLQRLEGDQPG